MRPQTLIFSGCFALLLLSACAAGSVDSHYAAEAGPAQQFLLGVWHGLIAPVMLLVEIINKFVPHLLPWKVRMFEPDGTGIFYDAGFYLGIAGGGPIIITRWPRGK